MYQRDSRAGGFLGGDRVSGQDIRDQNGASWSFRKIEGFALICGFDPA